MAHIRSILPQRGGVSPVDNNTAALFHYDEHVKDSLKSIAPIGNQYALSFNGTSQWVNCGTGLSIPSPGYNTVELWFKPYSLPATGTQTLISRTEGANFSIGILNTNVTVYYMLNGSYVTASVPTSLFSVGVWAHIATSYDGANIKVYVNGILKTTVAATGTYTENKNIPLIIGAEPNGSSGATTTPFNGLISEVRIWSRALSDSEILQTINNSISFDSSLIGCWKLHENTGSIAYDYSNNGNDGLLIDSPAWVEGIAIYNLVSGGYPGSAGKGLFIEEGTSNLMAGRNITKDAYANITHGTDAEGDYFIKTDNTTWYAGIRLPGIALNGGDTYTWSFEMKSDVAFNIQMDANVSASNYAGNDSGRSSTSIPITRYDTPGEWKQVRITGTIQADAVSPSLSDAFCPGNDSTALNRKIYYRNHQVEKKGYPTTYTSTSRGNHYLVYPSSVINPSGGTISFWMNPQRLTATNPIITNGHGESDQAFDILFGWDSTNGRMYIRRYWNGSAGQTQTSYGWPTNSVGQWWFITLTYGNGVPLRLYVNGQFVIETPGNADFSNYDGNIGIGSTFRNNPCMIIDELRFDKVIRTDTEIAAWYYQGRNGW